MPFSAKRRFFCLISSLFMCLASSCAEAGSSSKSGPNRTFGDTDRGASTAVKYKMNYTYRGDTDDDEVYYSDDFFRDASTEYNPHLATLSCYAAKFSMNRGSPNSDDDWDFFDAQPNRVESFYNLIGFTHFASNDDYRARTSFDTIGIGCAYKYVDGYAVIACVIRSGGYFNEWENNVFLGDGSKSDMMHEGWYNAANKTLDFIRYYISTTRIGVQKIKLWLSGYSRGAAVMNLTAGILDNRFDSDGKYSFGVEPSGFDTTLDHDGLYAYTFETPQGANLLSSLKHPKDPIYNNIFNIINPNDFVTKVGFAAHMCFTRFGVDKYITSKLNNAAGFDDSRKTVRALYGVDNAWNCDTVTLYNVPTTKILVDITNFVTFAVDLVTTFVDTGTTILPGFFEVDGTKANYDANILTTILIDEISDRIGSRENYKEKFEGPARLFVRLFVNDYTTGESFAAWAAALLKLGLLGIAESIFGAAAKVVYSWFADDDEVAFFDQLEPLVWAAARVFSVFPNEVMGLLAGISDIFDNHSTNISLSFVKSQDSLFIDAYNAEHADDPIKLCPLLGSSTFRRIRFRDFNDLGVYDLNDGSKQQVSVDGGYFGSSEITRCNSGYAVGYYSYATYEAMELFLPVHTKLKVNYTDYSKKLWHEVTATSYYYSFCNAQKPNSDYYTHKYVMYNEPDEWMGVDTRSNIFDPGE